MTATPATIQVQYVNQPKQAHWKSGSIKDAANNRWSIDKGFLNYFQPGESCEILWEQIGQYPTIVGKGGQLFHAAPAQPAPGSAVPPAQPQQAGPPRNAAWPTAPAQSLAYTPDKQPDTPEEIFITGIVGRAMGSGSFSIADIPELAKTAAFAWRTRHDLSQYQQEIEAATRPAGMTDIPMGDPQDPGWS